MKISLSLTLSLNCKRLTHSFGGDPLVYKSFWFADTASGQFLNQLLSPQFARILDNVLKRQLAQRAQVPHARQHARERAAHAKSQNCADR